MTNIIIEGSLGKLIGREWSLKVRNFKELFNAININTDDKLRNCMISKSSFAVFCDGKMVDPDEFLTQNVQNKDVLIIPVLVGGAVAIATAITTAVLPSVAAGTVAFKVTVFVLSSVISAAISFGITFLISKLLKTDDPEQINTSSFIFSSAENTASQGGIVPVGYGRFRIGSKIISSSLSSVDKLIFDNMKDEGFFNTASSNKNSTPTPLIDGFFSTL